MKEDILLMSQKELNRNDLIQLALAKKITQRQAAEQLQISERHLRRLIANYRETGVQALVSKRRGRPSNYQLEPQLKQNVIDLLHSQYADFGPTLVSEKLWERHRLKLSKETVRQLMIQEGLWKPKSKRRKTIHQMRQRRACFGELIQLDGSPHDWFEGRAPRCSLLVLIDDATGRLVGLRFVEAETTFAYFQVVRDYIEHFGRPLAFYSDKHSVFRVNQPRPMATTSGLTQFGRAMDTLDIQIICAHTPQAKGRVERANLTLQDRLVKELRLKRISDRDAANAFLPRFIIDFNQRFAVAPRSSHDAHRPLSSRHDLDLIFTKQAVRTLSDKLTFQFDNSIYQIRSSKQTYALRNLKVTVCQAVIGEIFVLCNGRRLDFQLYQPPVKQSQIVNSKSVNQVLPASPKPPAHHPWRRYGKRVSDNDNLLRQPFFPE